MPRGGQEADMTDVSGVQGHGLGLDEDILVAELRHWHGQDAGLAFLLIDDGTDGCGSHSPGSGAEHVLEGKYA